MEISPLDLIVPEAQVRIMHLGDAAARAQVLDLVGGRYAHRLVQRLESLDFDWVADAKRSDPQMPKFSKRLWKAVTSKDYRYDIDNFHTTYRTDEQTMARCAEIINAPRENGRVLVHSALEPDPPRQMWEGENDSCFYSNRSFPLIADMGFHYVKVAKPFVLDVQAGDDEEPRVVGKMNAAIISYGGELWTPLGRFLYTQVPDADGNLHPFVMNAYNGVTIETAQEIVGELIGEHCSWRSVPFRHSISGGFFWANGDKGYTTSPVIDYRLVGDAREFTCARSGQKGRMWAGVQVQGKWYLRGHEPEIEKCPECGHDIVKGEACYWCSIEGHPVYKGLVDAVELVERIFNERGI